jgi:hypothetical protein
LLRMVGIGWDFDTRGQLCFGNNIFRAIGDYNCFKLPSPCSLVAAFGCGWYHSFCVLEDGPLFRGGWIMGNPSRGCLWRLFISSSIPSQDIIVGGQYQGVFGSKGHQVNFVFWREGRLARHGSFTFNLDPRHLQHWISMQLTVFANNNHGVTRARRMSFAKVYCSI